VRILLVDDDPVSLQLLEATLTKWEYRVLSARDGVEAWNILRRPESPRLVIIDWTMPRMDGLELCRRIRSERDSEYTYVMLLTARTRKEEMLRGLEAGADDYITKPFDPREVKVRVRAAERILNLQQELMATQRALREQATRDSLTGLWNRAATVEMLETELSRARRAGTPMGVILGDLDNFKAINDAYGHAAGDLVLCEAGQRMREALRKHDHIGRYGGEEFLVVAVGCGSAETLNLAERLRSTVGDEPFHLERSSLWVTISLGQAVCCDPDANAEQMICRADEALYRAKRAGRNRVEPARAKAISPSD